MKSSILGAILLFYMTIIFAQEDMIKYNEVSLPKNELAFSVGYFISMGKPAVIWRNLFNFECYNFSYLHRFDNKWFWFGVNSNLWFERFDGDNNPAITLSPLIRFSYLNKTDITIYSGFSFGLGVYMVRSYKELAPFIQLTFFGFSVGKNLFAGGEFGFGFKGILCANVGYRF